MFKILFLFLLSSSSINAYKLTKLNIKKLPFNLNKNSLWVSYPVNTNCIKKINNMIPNSHYLYKCKVFENDLPKYRLFLNIFEVKTPFFHGNRMEVVTLIKNRCTYETSFVVLDCFTDAMAWDPIEGLKQSNALFKKNINEKDYNLEVKNKKKEQIFSISAKRSKVYKRPLKKFSIYSNYLCFFKNYSKGFPLEFNETEINSNVEILKKININNNIYSDFLYKYDNIFIYNDNMNFRVFL